MEAMHYLRMKDWPDDDIHWPKPEPLFHLKYRCRFCGKGFEYLYLCGGCRYCHNEDLCEERYFAENNFYHRCVLDFLPIPRGDEIEVEIGTFVHSTFFTMYFHKACRRIISIDALERIAQSRSGHDEKDCMVCKNPVEKKRWKEIWAKEREALVPK